MIQWGSLGLVAVVALVAAVAVVVLVSFALVGLSARARAKQVGGPEDGAPPPVNPAVGTAVATVCLIAVAAIVVYGLAIVVGVA